MFRTSCLALVASPFLDVHARGVVFLVSDGWGVDGQTLTREVRREMDSRDMLALDPFKVGSSITYSTDNLVTDSAAGATCFSCGVKSYNGAVGMAGTSRADAVWCGTVLEAASQMGWKTGVVATSRVTHATPASFNSHVPSRNAEEDIAAQQIDLGFTDLMLGGGKRSFDPTKRYDARDVIGDAKTKGWSYAETKSEMAALTLPALGLFSSSHMAYEVDRKYSPEQPSLLEMTEKALELLSADGNDFFLMVEGSRIDHASHGNDPVGHVMDARMYDLTAQHVMDFAEKYGDVLVVSTSDHETGGIGLSTGGVYGYHPEELIKAQASAEYLQDKFDANTTTPVKLIEEHTSYTLTDREKAMIDESLAMGDYFYNVVAQLYSARARIGWTTSGHTGPDVPVFAAGWGFRSTEWVNDLTGSHENNDIGVIVAQHMGIDLPIYSFDEPWQVDLSAASRVVDAVVSVVLAAAACTMLL